MSVKTQSLTDLIEPVVNAFGLDLWGLQYSSSGAHAALLRVFIDSAEGVDVEDCAKVSRQLSAVLDVEDPISGKYILEVSSPGLDRPLFTLQQYQQFVGETIKLKLNRSINKRKKFKAYLRSVDEQKQLIEIECDGESLQIEFINIDKANVLGDIALFSKQPPKKH